MIGQIRRRYIVRDLTRQQAATIALTLLLILSAAMMVTGASMLERLNGAVDRLFDEARPPHFLQMHRGDIDELALDRFAAAHPEVADWQIHRMVGIDGSQITWQNAERQTSSLSESLIDHLFVAQNPHFDFLVDEAGRAPYPSDGEVYLPVALAAVTGLDRGDSITVDTGTDRPLALQVAGQVRDAQMASSFASSTRLLVSEDDLARLQMSGGDPEAIIEYRLQDPAMAAEFQHRYEAQAELPQNGQAVTFDVIRLLNALGDGIVAVTLMLAGLLVIGIAFVTVRFVIRGTIEDEVQQIGALRALGLDQRLISSLSLAKYRLIAATGCLLGGALTPPLLAVLLPGVLSSYGSAAFGAATVLAPLIALIAVYTMTISVCRATLRRAGRIDVVRALVHGSTRRTRSRPVRRPRQTPHRLSLTGASWLPVDVRVELAGLWAERSRWALLVVVFALAAPLATVPTSLLSTLKHPRFVTYMGAPAADLRTDLQFGEGLAAAHHALRARMDADPRLTGVRSYARLPHEVLVPDPDSGTLRWEALPVEAGDYSDSTLEFITGTAPSTGEIAVSALVAERSGIGPGDRLSLRTRDAAGARSETIVSGVYQDITSGGRTAKLHDPDAAARDDASGFIVYASITDPSRATGIASEYDREFPEASTVPIQEYARQTLASVTGALHVAAALSGVFGVGVAALITGLFLHLQIARNRRELGIRVVLGSTSRELHGGLLLTVLIPVLTGTLLGLTVTAVLAEAVVSAVFAGLGLGLTHLTLLPNPWLSWLLCPAALLAAAALAVTVNTRSIRRDAAGWPH